MRFERLATPDAAIYPAAMELYRLSFPYHEQREAASQAEILGWDAYHFSAIFEGDQFLGLMLYWDTEKFLYVEHFCIVQEMRGKRYGEKALEELKRLGKPVILEIDPPVDEISIRRKGFYERVRFVENPYPHNHPAYHMGCHPHRLVVMSAPEALSGALYEEFAGYLNNVVMKPRKQF